MSSPLVLAPRRFPPTTAKASVPLFLFTSHNAYYNPMMVPAYGGGGGGPMMPRGYSGRDGDEQASPPDYHDASASLSLFHQRNHQHHDGEDPRPSTLGPYRDRYASEPYEPRKVPSHNHTQGRVPALLDTAHLREGELRLAPANPQMTMRALEERRKDGVVEQALAVELRSGRGRDEDEDGGLESGPPVKKKKKMESLEEAVKRLLPTNPELGKAFKAAQRSLNNVFAATGERLDLHQLTATRLSKLQLEYSKKRDVAAAAAIDAALGACRALMKAKKEIKDKGKLAQQSKARIADRDRRRANGVSAQISIDDVTLEAARGAGGSLSIDAASITRRRGEAEACRATGRRCCQCCRERLDARRWRWRWRC